MTSSSWASRLTTGGRHRVVALPGARPAQLGEIRERRLVVGDREAREAVLLEAEIDRARRRELDRRRHPRRPRPSRRAPERRPERRHLRARLQRRLGVRPAQVTERVERPAVLDGGQDVGQLAVLGRGVVDVVGDDDRQPEVLGKGGRLGDEPVVVGQEVVRQLDEEAARGRPVAAPEERRVALGHGAGTGEVARPEAAGQLPVAAAGQRHEALGVLGEERLAEARDGLRAGHVGPRHEPAETPPADLRPGEEHEVRAADTLADAAQVLLDRLAMAGQAGTGRAGTARDALGRVRGHGRGGGRGHARAVAVGGAGRRSGPGPGRPRRAARSRDRRPGAARPPPRR